MQLTGLRNTAEVIAINGNSYWLRSQAATAAGHSAGESKPADQPKIRTPRPRRLRNVTPGAIIQPSTRLELTCRRVAGFNLPDAIAVRIMGKSLTELTTRGDVSDADSLRSLSQRPLAVCVPWPPLASDIERDYSGKLTILLGAAFFAKANEFLKRVGTKCTKQLDRWRGIAADWSKN